MTEVDPEALSPHPKNSELYGELGDVASLVRSIEENGFDETEPVEYVETPREDWPANRIVSGHRRWTAAKKVGLDAVPARPITFEDADAEIDYLKRKNQYRQLSDADLVRVGYDYERRHGDDVDGRTREAVAEYIDKSGEWYRRGKKALLAAGEGTWGDDLLSDDVRELAESEWGRVDDGSASVNSAYRAIKSEVDRAKSCTDENEGASASEGKVMTRDDGDGRANLSTTDEPPLNLGWAGDLEGEYARKARETGSEDLLEAVRRTLDDDV